MTTSVLRHHRLRQLRPPCPRGMPWALRAVRKWPSASQKRFTLECTSPWPTLMGATKHGRRIGNIIEPRNHAPPHLLRSDAPSIHLFRRNSHHLAKSSIDLPGTPRRKVCKPQKFKIICRQHTVMFDSCKLRRASSSSATELTVAIALRRTPSAPRRVLTMTVSLLNGYAKRRLQSASMANIPRSVQPAQHRSASKTSSSSNASCEEADTVKPSVFFLQEPAVPLLATDRTKTSSLSIPFAAHLIAGLHRHRRRLYVAVFAWHHRNRSAVTTEPASEPLVLEVRPTSSY